MYNYLEFEPDEEEDEEEEEQEAPPIGKFKIGFYYDFKTYKQPIKRLIYIIESLYCYLKVVNVQSEFIEDKHGFNIYKWNISADNVDLSNIYIIKKSDVRPYKAAISLYFSIFYKDDHEIKRVNDTSPKTKREPNFKNIIEAYELNYNYFTC